MTHSQESRVSSSQDTFRVTEKEIISSSVSALVNKLNSCSAIGSDCGKSDISGSSNRDDRKLEETFPWLKGFWESCRTSVGTRNIKVLENLVLEYLGKVSTSVKDCYMKPNRAAKLKKTMNDVLIFFHLCYHDMQESMDHSSYLDRMTDLVSMYMDMELKASRRRKESVKKIAYRLSACLYILLDNSEEHMLDAILKAKFFNKHYCELCGPLLEKILNRTHTYSMYEALYVRYLLVFKIWKKVVADSGKRREINKMAVARLVPPPNFVEKSKLINTVLPKIPKSKKSVTLFFMQAKFNLKTACSAFLKTCRESQQPCFTRNLALNIDKPMFFSDGRANSPTGLDEKEIGGGSGNLINDIWSSICNDGSVLENPGQLKDLTAEKRNTEQVAGKKKVKEKITKKKLNKKKEINMCLFDKVKKKKLKKKAVEAKVLLNGIASSSDSLLKNLCKGGKTTKKKKKKLPENPIRVLAPLAAAGVSIPASSKELCGKEISSDAVEVKLENPAIPIINKHGKEKEGYESSQLGEREISSVVTCEVSSADQKSLLVKKDKVQISEPLNQVDLVNSASSNENAVLHVPKETSQSSPETETVAVNQVHIVNSAGSEDTIESEHRVIVKTVDVSEPVQPSSTCSPPAVDVPVSSMTAELTVNTSQSEPVSVENEALATRSTESTSADSVVPRTIRDPVLVSSQSASSRVPDTVTYACDSSIKHEVPLSGDEDCSSGVNRVAIEMTESETQILAELRQRGTVKCDGEVDEVTLTEEFIRRENMDHLNLFHTGNDALVIQLLDELPEDSIPLPVAVRDDSSEATSSEGFEVLDPLYLSSIMNSFLISKTEVNGKECLLRGMMDSENADIDIVSLQNQETGKSIMEGDGVSTDEETENCYDLVATTHNGSTNITKRKLPIAAKVIPTAVISSTGNAQSPAERELSETPVSSPTEEPFKTGAIPDNAYPCVANSTCESDSIREIPNHPHISTVDSSALSSVTTAENVRDIPVETAINEFVSEFGASRAENRIERSEVSQIDRDVRGIVESSSKKVVHKNSENSVSAKPQCIQEHQFGKLSVTLTQYNPLSVESVSRVESDVLKDSEQPVKELQKSTQRGMFVESNSSCGKLPRVPYTAMPVPGAIYPYSYPAPVHVGKYIPAYTVDCACSDCYNKYLHMANYNQGITCYHEGPLQYTSSEAAREAEKMKAEDQELLRKIEESLIADKSVKCEEPAEEFESKCKAEVDSSLPLKKRLTLARVQTETKVKEEEGESNKLDGFPSYPRKPMMSIAELEKVHNFAKYVKYPGTEMYYPVDSYHVFPADYSAEETVIEIKDKKPSHELMHQYTHNVISTPVVGHTSHRSLPPFNYRTVVDNCQDPRFSQPYHSDYTSGNVNVTAAQGNFEYSGRQFKTPAQLKEIPTDSSTFINYSSIKTDHRRNAASVDQRNIEQTTDSGRNAYRVPKQEVFLPAGQGCSAGRHHMVNLSVDDGRSHNETRSHKSARRKKSRSSDNRSRNPNKRSRSRTQSVIQNADTVDDFMKSFETKRRRKHVSR